jgi:phosphoribosylaminoimidazole (AIR) synthetase
MSTGLSLPYRDTMVEGDVLLVLASDGLNSKGFPLIRHRLVRTFLSRPE